MSRIQAISDLCSASVSNGIHGRNQTAGLWDSNLDMRQLEIDIHICRHFTCKYVMSSTTTFQNSIWNIEVMEAHNLLSDSVPADQFGHAGLCKL